MKSIFYLFTAVLMTLSLQSCKRIQDENGDLLSNDGNAGEGLTGERFLYREFNQGELEKEYHYDKRKLMEVIQPKDSSRTTIEYNVNRINSISYTQVYNNDSTAYKRIYYYNEQSKVDEIREVKVFKAADQEVLDTYKSVYLIAYDDAGVLKTITMKTGQQLPDQQDFSFTAYTKSDYVFEGENVVSQTKVYGMMDGENFGGITSRSVYQYADYDEKIAPFTLISYDYKLSQLISAEAEAYRFSANNLRKVTFSSTENPNPVVETSLFTYDPQDYALLGFSKMYDYRPL